MDNMIKDSRLRSGMFAALGQGLLTGLISGYLLAFLLGQSVWLEMRVNIGWALPVTTITGAVFFTWREITLAYGWFLLLQVMALTVLGVWFGFSTGPILVVPACLLREGFLVGNADMGTVNLFQSLILLTGNGWWLVHDLINRKHVG